MPRLFVAAWPSAEVVERPAPLPRPAVRGVRWVSPDQWHITLRFVGDAEIDDVANRLTRAVLPRTVARAGPDTERLGGGQLVVPVDGLDDLATAVIAATADIGRVERRPFHGHLTLARTKGRATAPLGRFDAVDFAVDHVALVTSEPTDHGSRYTTVATFPTS